MLIQEREIRNERDGSGNEGEGGNEKKAKKDETKRSTLASERRELRKHAEKGTNEMYRRKGEREF